MGRQCFSAPCMEPPWRSAGPSLQQPLEGRKQLPNVSGLYPGTAGLPDRMAGTVGPEGLSSRTQVPSLVDTRMQPCAQAGQGVMAGRESGKGEWESEQSGLLLSGLRCQLGNGLAFYWQGHTKEEWGIRQDLWTTCTYMLACTNVYTHTGSPWLLRSPGFQGRGV